jgi:hypothetical protein
MEEFKPDEQKPAPEQQESVENKTSGEKLEKLLDPQFKDYVLRFVNLDEYKKIINGEAGGGEVYLPEASFEEYKKNILNLEEQYGWDQHIHWQADWDRSADGVKAHKYLLSLLRSAHARAKEELKTSDENISIREKTIQLFRRAIDESVGLSYPRMSQRILENRIEAGEKEVSSEISERNETAKKMPQDEYWQEEDVLREVMESLTHSQDDAKKTVLNQQELRDYHIQVILAKSGITPNKHQEAWGYITKAIEGKDVLGAIALMTDRELLEEMASLSKESGDYAHPVFDSHFNVRFPKQENDERFQ